MYCVGYPLALVPRGSEVLAQGAVVDKPPPSSPMAGPGWTRGANPASMASGQLHGVPDYGELLLEGRGRAFLVHTAGVGPDQAGVTGQAEEGAVIRRRHLESVQPGSEGVPGGGEPGPRVQREQYEQTELAQLIQDGLEPLRIVSVLRAVDGSEDVLVRLGA
jgi:hypothetical protein